MIEQTIEIPQYLRQVKLSESRKRKYYELGKKLPVAKKYADRTKYDYKTYNKKQYLVDLETGERVLANPQAAGTPNMMSINGQKLYNGAMHKHTRNKVMQDLKAFMTPFVNQLDPVTDFPLIIEMELHDTIRETSSNSLWDLDNRAWPYIKTFQDCLTGNKDRDGNLRCKQIIPDDNLLFVTTPPVPKFIPVATAEERKLVFRLKAETDKRILEDKEHSKQLKEAIYEFRRVSSGDQQDMED